MTNRSDLLHDLNLVVVSARLGKADRHGPLLRLALAAESAGWGDVSNALFMLSELPTPTTDARRENAIDTIDTFLDVNDRLEGRRAA